MKTFLFITTLFSGLVAGLLYAYSCSVNPGLKMLSNVAYIKSMQGINTAIQNPVFFIAFMGLLLVFPVVNYQLYQQHNTVLALMIAAMLIYMIGVFGVTILFNVPLNNQLAKFSADAATANETAAMRQAFEQSWNKYHTIRTIASVASFSLVILSLMKQKIQ
ncbi:MAG: DUF1772 domain-containing protein [Agriterribacter sp.]